MWLGINWIQKVLINLKKQPTIFHFILNKVDKWVYTAAYGTETANTSTMENLKKHIIYQLFCIHYKL